MTDITVDTPLASILTNKRRLGALKSLGVLTVMDALTYYPFRVTDPVPVRALGNVAFGQKMACTVSVRAVRVIPMNSRGGYRLEVLVADPHRSTATLVFFSRRKSYVDWMAGRLQPGLVLVIAGEPTIFNDHLQFTHPEVLTVAPPQPAGPEPHLAFDTPGQPNAPAPRLRFDVDTVEQGLARVTRPRPVYHANSRISSEHIHETILQLIGLLAGQEAPRAIDRGTARGTTPAQPSSGPAGPGTRGTPATHVTQHAPGSNPTPGIQHQPATPHASLYAADPAARTRLHELIPDVLPEQVRAANELMHRAQALCAIHDPDSVRDFTEAIRTMRFEEAFVCQCALLMARAAAGAGDAHPCTDTTLRDRYIDSLPFALTRGQRDVIDTIGADMSHTHPMQRLLQGEVGSGKTVVAVCAMLQAVGSGYQAVLVAPTQVLAEQHYRSISAAVGDDVPVILLTGGMRLAARRKALATAASGEPCIVVATHAAFSRSFQAPRLALAVIDEQHRFGVEQRDMLRAKSDPHLLVMTATPIPRTAAMTWFGDLDISWLTELPGGRKPIRTFVIPEADARLVGSMFWHLRKRIDAGERAYVVCARIDADEEEDAGADDRGDSADLLLDDAQDQPRPPLHSVEEIAARLASLPQFQGVGIATLTGRDDDATKQETMAKFADGTTPLLVATTVIEVGVDVPQASCIVIFDADRYGLSQLHQLRGRVGRGGTDSWAFLVSRAEGDTIAQERLAVIEGSLDGAVIAEKDLELRGAGDVLGDAQSGGKSSLKLLRVVKDARMIERARAQAEELLARDPRLDGDVQLAGAVLDFTRGNEKFLTSN